MEEHFHLERGALDAVEYKSAITAATKAALVGGIDIYSQILLIHILTVEGRSTSSRGGEELTSRETDEDKTQVGWDHERRW